MTSRRVGLLLVSSIVIVVLAVVIANQLATSISNFISSIPDLRNRLPEIVAPWQARLKWWSTGRFTHR